MLLEMNKVIAEIAPKESDLSPTDRTMFHNMRACASKRGFNPSLGQLEALKAINSPKPAKIEQNQPEMDEKAEKVSQKPKNRYKKPKNRL